MDLIIGAGITGLSFANFTKNTDFLIIEKDPLPGGYCKTVKQDGFVWDYSGHFFHFRNKDIKNFLMERMHDKKIKTLIRSTQIRYKNLFIDYPFQKNIHQLSKKEFIECLFDLFTTPENRNYKTFKEMLYGKFGRAISEKFLIPYNEKLYACDLDDLDVNAMGRFFPYAEKDEIIRNFKIKDDNYYNNTFTYPTEGAMEYVYALLKGIDIRKVILNEELISIDIKKKEAKTNKQIIKFNKLISTIPFPIFLDKCQIPYEKSLYNWNKVLVFNLGFNKKGIDVNNHWIYFPEKKYSFYRVGYYDNILSSNRMSLYVEIGFNRFAQINIEQERHRVLYDLKQAGIISDHILISMHYVIMNPAYVHIKEKSNQHKTLLQSELKTKNIYSIGRYGDWKYCSIEDNIVDALNLANEISK